MLKKYQTTYIGKGMVGNVFCRKNSNSLPSKRYPAVYQCLGKSAFMH